MMIIHDGFDNYLGDKQGLGIVIIMKMLVIVMPRTVVMMLAICK